MKVKAPKAPQWEGSCLGTSRKQHQTYRKRRDRTDFPGVTDLGMLHNNMLCERGRPCKAL